MNKQILRMQKLAGLITEGQYRRLTENQASGLINDGVVLHVSDDSKLAPGFIDPKRIGFIVYNVAVKDPSKSILSITGALSKNPKVVQIFNDNYGIIDINYISTFLTNPKNWKAITSEDELNNFMSKYRKVYLISHNGDSSELNASFNDSFNPFLDTDEGGYMREYLDDVVKDSMDRPNDSMDRPNGDEDDEDGIVQLDPKYRPDFDIAFDEALARLRKDHPELNFEAIEANKESFF